MGYGDNLMGSGMAKGARDRGEIIAFGDGYQILWDHNSETIFRDNPNVARYGDAPMPNWRFIPFYKGNRIYNKQDDARDRWIWNMDFRAQPGEMFFSKDEESWTKPLPRNFILIEPNIPDKRSAVNKLWPLERYQAVTDALVRKGHAVYQFQWYGMKHALANTKPILVKGFRQAVLAVRNAKLVICSEGGLHHAAAAMNTKAVVLFGGFIPPQVTGYDTHENLAVGEACGKYIPCDHCKEAMRKIEADQVLASAERLLAC